MPSLCYNGAAHVSDSFWSGPTNRAPIGRRMMIETAIDGIPADLRKKVLSLELPANWDGEDADVVTGETCRCALAFLSEACADHPTLLPVSVAPSVAGAVSLFWRQAEHYLMVEVSASNPGSVRVQSRGPNGRRDQREMPRASAIRLLISLFSRGK